MDVFFHDKLQLQVFTIDRPRIIAAFNFKIHKSLEYLDLSSNEYQFGSKSVFTEEDMRKWIQPDRQILYKYHLDLPEVLESFDSWDRIDIVSQNAFHLREICVCDSVYGNGFQPLIVKAIESHESNKAEKLKNYMKIFSLLGFNQCLRSTLYFYDKLLPVLYVERCTDSELVINFVSLFNFIWWLLNSENPNVLKYVLHHLQRIHCGNHLWLLLQSELNPVIACFLRHKIMNVRILLMYGTPITIPPGFDFNHFIDIPDWVFYVAVSRGVISYRRVFLVFQLLFDFQYHQQVPDGLRCTWNSIKDPFLSHSEIFLTLVPVVPHQVIFRVHSYYAMCVSGNNNEFCTSPRTLKHLCRVEIRELLNSLNALPYGIVCLDIPETLKSYLYEY